ncbi:hypothetical protein BG000_000802, partial [Podila horticola]
MEEKHGSDHGPTSDPKDSPEAPTNSNPGDTPFKRGPVSPENYASGPSRLILWWMNGLFRQGYKNRIEEDDLYEMLDRNKAGFLAEGLMEQWNQEQARAKEKGRKPSLLRAVFWAFWERYYTIPIGLELGDACQVSQPLVLQQASGDIAKENLISAYFYTVITFINNSATDNPPAVWHGYGLAFGLAALAIFQNLLYQRWNLGSVAMGVYIRASLIDVVFRKATALSSKAHLIYPDGAIVNLMSTDASRIDTAMLSAPLVVSVPIYTLVIVGLLIHLMGPSALLGAAILVLVNPVQGWAMSRLAPIRKRASQFTDGRIRLTSEILQGIKVIKFFSWENNFLEKLSEIRKHELYNVAKLLYIRGAVAATSASLPVLASALSFILYTSLGNELKSEIIFPALAYFTVLRTPLIVLPTAYTLTVDAY